MKIILTSLKCQRKVCDVCRTKKVPVWFPIQDRRSGNRPALKENPWHYNVYVNYFRSIRLFQESSAALNLLAIPTCMSKRHQVLFDLLKVTALASMLTDLVTELLTLNNQIVAIKNVCDTPCGILLKVSWFQQFYLCGMSFFVIV